MAKDSPTMVYFSFVSQALEADTFQVMGFKGEEEISKPYRIEIDLVADNPDIDLEKLLFSPASLSIERDDQTRKVHGVVAECQVLDALPMDRYQYRVVLVPRIWLLTMSRQNQIYQSQSVPDIIAQEIKSATAKGATRHAAAGLTTEDFELRLTRDYPKREYVVQYGESDLNFISRLMEHEGIFYFFEQGEEREKLIISDNNIHFAYPEDQEPIPYRPKSGLSSSGDDSVQTLTCTTRRIPRKLVLKDYNYRLPHVMLQAEADVDSNAHGMVSEYGDHFKLPEEGSELARIRAQEILCSKQTFEGKSDSLRLQPGWRFKLDEHFRESFNDEYVVTAIQYEGRQPMAGTAGFKQDADGEAGYGNTFVCIASDVHYRPPRVTPKPVIPGIMNAQVDASMLEDRAEIDDQGRYKLVLPFDLSGAGAGKASRFVRKAQPYGGQDMGMHFPLHKGTEVVCNFINGDPDRPIIVGVVPNPLTASIVAADSHTKNRIKTASGVFMEFNDGPGAAPSPPAEGGENLGKQQQMQSMDSVFNLSAGSSASGPDTGKQESLSGHHHVETHGKGQKVDPLQSRGLRLQQQQQADNDTYKESDSQGTADKWFRVKVPNYERTKDSYLRLGASVSEEAVEQKEIKDDVIKKQYSVALPADTTDHQHAMVEITCNEGNDIVIEPSDLPEGVSQGPSFSLTGNTSGVSITHDGKCALIAPPPPSSGNKNFDIIVTHQNRDKVTVPVSLTVNAQDQDLYPDGWYDFTSGDYSSMVRGNRYVHTHGDKLEIIEGTHEVRKKPADDDSILSYENTTQLGPFLRKHEVGWKSETALSIGSEESLLIGNRLDTVAGTWKELVAGLRFNAFTGGAVNVDLNWIVNFGLQDTINWIDGDEYKISEEHVVDAEENICLSVPLQKGGADLITAKERKTAAAAVAISATVAGLAAGCAGLGATAASNKTKPWDCVADFSGLGVSAALDAVTIATLIQAHKYKRKIKTKQEKRKSDRVDLRESRVELTDKDAEILCGKSSIILTDDKIEMKCGKSSIVIDDQQISLKCGTAAEALLKGEGTAKLGGSSHVSLATQVPGNIVIGNQDQKVIGGYSIKIGEPPKAPLSSIDRDIRDAISKRRPPEMDDDV